jgi:hypothetical protein
MWKLGLTLPFGASASGSVRGADGESVWALAGRCAASRFPSGGLSRSFEPSAAGGDLDSDRPAPPILPSLIDRPGLVGRLFDSASSLF